MRPPLIAFRREKAIAEPQRERVVVASFFDELRARQQCFYIVRLVDVDENAVAKEVLNDTCVETATKQMKTNENSACIVMLRCSNRRNLWQFLEPLCKRLSRTAN